MAVRYLATISPLDVPAVHLPVLSLEVKERQGLGWIGEAIVDPRPRVHLKATSAFAYTLQNRLAPGKSVLIKLIVASDSDNIEVRGTIAKAWPAVLTYVTTTAGHKPGFAADYLAQVVFVDPLRYFGHTAIWGVFADLSPGEMLGGLLRLANGQSGTSTLMPVLRDMPVIHISQHIHTSLQKIPYLLATGERLSTLLFFFLGRLGIRMEMSGDAQGRFGITLKDQRPTGELISLLLGSGQELSLKHGTLISMTNGPLAQPRAIVLDNASAGDFKRTHPAGSVGAVINAAKTTFEQVQVRAIFQEQYADSHRSTMLIGSGQPALSPGKLTVLRQTSAATDSVSTWQVSDITHIFQDGRYLNTFTVGQDNIPWRPPIPNRDSRTVIVAGTVDINTTAGSTTATPGDSVERDTLGRILVSFPFTQTLPKATGTMKPLKPLIALPISEQMAGGAHGFIPTHRQGDICKVLVHNPSFAEIIGFSYRSNFINETMVDVSAGLVMEHQLDNWAGVLFRSKHTTKNNGANP